MATEENVMKVFETVCAAITEAGLRYERNDAKRVIEFTLAANPFPVAYRIAVRAANKTISFFSELPFRVPKDRAEWFAKRLSKLVFDNLYVGTFDFNPDNGLIVFRTEIMYQESLISKQTIQLMKNIVYDTVTKHTEALFRLSRGEE